MYLGIRCNSMKSLHESMGIKSRAVLPCPIYGQEYVKIVKSKLVKYRNRPD
jgi:hypothetical protein